MTGSRRPEKNSASDAADEAEPPQVAGPTAPPETASGHDRQTHPGDDDDDLVDRAEALADRTLSAFVDKVELPDVRAEAAKARDFFKSIDSWALWAVLIAFFSAAGAGVAVVLIGVPPVGTLPDWYMHAAMYAVIFSCLVLYLKAHLSGHRFRRGIWAILTTAQCAFFGWVLLDRIPPRTLVVIENSLPVGLERPAFGLLALPAWLLLGTAAFLALHWLIFARFRRRAVALEAEANKGEEPR